MLRSATLLILRLALDTSHLASSPEAQYNSDFALMKFRVKTITLPHQIMLQEIIVKTRRELLTHGCLLLASLAAVSAHASTPPLCCFTEFHKF